ncbi:hypothetical protein Leryth_012990 [Lithospermum erythrorhizon]|nr:hypothetical protein Leryth_012990 [Lithospermum erythrorhizon]
MSSSSTIPRTKFMYHTTIAVILVAKKQSRPLSGSLTALVRGQAGRGAQNGLISFFFGSEEEPKTYVQQQSKPNIPYHHTSPSIFSSFANQFLNQSPKMDEVWKDINFPSFQEHSSIDHLRSSNFHSTNFQHLFSLSFSTSSSSRYGSPVPPPATMLTLNTTHVSHLFRSNGPLREVPPLMQYHTVPKICPHSSKPVDFFPDSNAKKRQLDIDSSNSDRRHKRMIKNRDAAARLIQTS